MKHKSVKFQLYKRTLLVWHFQEFCDYATRSNICGPRVITSVQNVYSMRVVTDIGKYVTVAAKKIILQERSMKKLEVKIEVTKSRLFMEEGSVWRPPDVSGGPWVVYNRGGPTVATGLNCLFSCFKKEKNNVFKQINKHLVIFSVHWASNGKHLIIIMFYIFRLAYANT